MTDKQRIRSLEATLRAAIKALQPMTMGTYWINRGHCAKAAQVIERASKILPKRG